MAEAQQTVLVEVFVPACGRSFDVRLPEAMNVRFASRLAAQALAPLSEGAYQASRSSVLAWRDSGKLLNAQHTLKQECVCNGSRLLLV